MVKINKVTFDNKVPHAGFELISTDDSTCFRSRKKFKSGMTGEVSFEVFGIDDDPRAFIADISFVIYRKRNKAWVQPNEITGRDGLEPMVWAKQEIEAFGEYIWMKSGLQTGHLIIGWTDKRRGELYRKAFSKQGFILSRIDGELVMKKKISRIPLNQLKYQFA